MLHEEDFEVVLKAGEEGRARLHDARKNSRIGAGGIRYYHDPLNDPFWDDSMAAVDPAWDAQYKLHYLSELHKDPSAEPSEFVYKPLVPPPDGGSDDGYDF